MKQNPKQTLYFPPLRAAPDVQTKPKKSMRVEEQRQNGGGMEGQAREGEQDLDCGAKACLEHGEMVE